MLIQTPNDNERFFFLLKEAVLKNTVRPRPEEEVKMTISKVIRCSPEIEGDSQLGIMLFCGVAYMFYGIPVQQIIDHLGMEPEEFNYKVKKFIENYNEASKLGKLNDTTSFHVIDSKEFDLRKLYNKVRLINNYIKFNHQKHNVLLSRRK